MLFENNTNTAKTELHWNPDKSNKCCKFCSQTAPVSIKDSTLLFYNNSAHLSGGITTVGAPIALLASTCMIFENNEGGDGGAMAFYEKTKLAVGGVNVTVIFHQNKARKRGGAIFVQDSDCYERSSNHRPFISHLMPYTQVQIIFSNNTAALAGNDIYGG